MMEPPATKPEDKLIPLDTLISLSFHKPHVIILTLHNKECNSDFKCTKTDLY